MFHIERIQDVLCIFKNQRRREILQVRLLRKSNLYEVEGNPVALPQPLSWYVPLPLRKQRHESRPRRSAVIIAMTHLTVACAMRYNKNQATPQIFHDDQIEHKLFTFCTIRSCFGYLILVMDNPFCIVVDHFKENRCLNTKTMLSTNENSQGGLVIT